MRKIDKFQHQWDLVSSVCANKNAFVTVYSVTHETIYLSIENPLIEMLLQDRGLMDGPAGIQGPLRDMLNYLIHEHGDDDEDEDEDGAGMPAD